MTHSTVTMHTQANSLLADPKFRREELMRVMAEHPMLTLHGLGWRAADGYRYQLPTVPALMAVYQEQRDALLHTVLTTEECMYATAGSHVGEGMHTHRGEIPLALTYLTYCQHGKLARQGSYGMKHRAEAIEPAGYVSNGAMIAAVGMVGGKIANMNDINARLGVIEPRRCGERGTRYGGCGVLLPAGTKKRLCDECRRGRRF